MSLEFIPDEVKTYEMCKSAIILRPLELRFVPEWYKTKEICEIAVRKCGRTIIYVPEKLRTLNLCYTAYRTDKFDIKIFSEDMCTMIEVLGMIWTGYPRYRYEIYRLPEKLKTYEFFTEACRISDDAMLYVPKHLLTYKFCLDMVEINCDTLKYVPHELRTYYMCLKALSVGKTYSAIINAVPKKIITTKLFMDLYGIRKDYPLKQIPEDILTYELCIKAIKNNPSDIHHVPKKFMFRYSEIIKLRIKKYNIISDFVFNFQTTNGKKYFNIILFIKN